MADTELAPCPFCGGAAHVDDHHDDRDSRVIECQECGANVGANELAAGVEHWNRRAATKAAAPADAPSEPIMANGLPVERAQMDWVCHFLNGNSVFDGNDILQAWNALVAFYVARRASSVPAIPGTGRVKEAGDLLDWLASCPAGTIRMDWNSFAPSYINWGIGTTLKAAIARARNRAAPSHPSEAKAGEDA